MNGIPICRACRTLEASSGEHLFQSAIGGRLEVPGVLCKPCNDRFGQTIDGDLATALEWFRMMLAIEGDRGQTASIRTVDGDGRHHFLRPGLLPESAETRPTVVKVDDNTLTFTTHSEKQARQIVEAYQRKRPDETLIVQEVKVQKIFPTKTNVPVNFRGEDFFRPAVKTVLVLLAHMGLESHDALVNAWRYVNGERAEDCDLRVFWSSEAAPWSDDVLGVVSHRVSVRSDSESGLLTADVRYFGDFAFCIRIGVRLGTSFAVGYGVDPLTGRTAASRDWSGAIGNPNAPDSNAIYDAIERAFAQVSKAAEPISRRALCERIVNECTEKVLGSRTGGTVNEAEQRAIVECARKELAFILQREDGEEEAPELLRVLQEAAGKKRPGTV